MPSEPRTLKCSFISWIYIYLSILRVRYEIPISKNLKKKGGVQVFIALKFLVRLESI